MTTPTTELEKTVLDVFEDLEIFCSKTVAVQDGDAICFHYETADATEDIKSFILSAMRKASEHTAKLDREAVADLVHQIWSHWAKYQITCGKLNSDASFTISAALTERWIRQMNTVYKDLTETEKESDRHQADKIIALLDSQREREIDVE